MSNMVIDAVARQSGRRRKGMKNSEKENEKKQPPTKVSWVEPCVCWEENLDLGALC